MSKILDVIKSALSDNSGGWSSIRIAMWVTLGVILVVWVRVAFKTSTVPDIPTGVLGFATMITGLKALQRAGEQPAP